MNGPELETLQRVMAQRDQLRDACQTADAEILALIPYLKGGFKTNMRNLRRLLHAALSEVTP